MDDADFFEEDEPRLGVILKVPNGVTPVRAAGVLNAYWSFQTLSSNLGDLFDYMSERVRTFFKEGAPLADRREWDLTNEPTPICRGTTGRNNPPLRLQEQLEQKTPQRYTQR